MWGLDSIGKINSDNKRYFYLKDHLGTVRAVIDTANNIVSAQDVDCWGYIMSNRTYQSDNSKYKFTSKERDAESNYDYFGARYYDSRIASWGSVDPLLEKHFDCTPYNYVLRNPIVLIDPDGKQRVPLTNAQTAYDGGGGDIMGPVSVGFTLGLGYEAYKAFTHIFTEPNNLGELNFINPILGTIPEIIIILNEAITIAEGDKIPSEGLNPPKKRGDAPTSKKTGEKVEIHHVGQTKGGPYKEMFEKEHRGPGKYKEHHDPKKPSEREKNWSNLVKKYWKEQWDSGRFNK